MRWPDAYLQTQIRTRIDAFAAELASVVQQAALESIQAVLGGDGAAPARRGPGRPRGSTTRRKGGRKRGGARGRRGRPPSADTAALTSKVLAYVKANPGQSISEIAAALGTTSDQVRPVVVQLLGEKQVRTSGQKRGTKYHAGGSGGEDGLKPATRKGRKAKRKATRKKAARRAPRRKVKSKGARTKAARKASPRKATRKAAHRRAASAKSTAQELAEAVARKA